MVVFYLKLISTQSQNIMNYNNMFRPFKAKKVDTFVLKVLQPMRGAHDELVRHSTRGVRQND